MRLRGFRLWPLLGNTDHWQQKQIETLKSIWIEWMDKVGDQFALFLLFLFPWDIWVRFDLSQIEVKVVVGPIYTKCTFGSSEWWSLWFGGQRLPSCFCFLLFVGTPFTFSKPFLSFFYPNSKIGILICVFRLYLHLDTTLYDIIK